MIIEGMLICATVDNCENYNPDMSKPIGVRSFLSGEIYHCKNLDEPPNIPGAHKGCFLCKNKLDKLKMV